MNPATRSRLEAEAAKWFTDWDLRLADNRLKHLWPAFRNEREAATKHFLAGAEALERIMCEAAPEFDDDAAENELDRREAMVSLQMKDDDPDRFIDGARWMHQQNVATIEILKARIKELEER